MRVLVLYNPAARRCNQSILELLQKDSTQAGWSLLLSATSSLKDAYDQAVQAVKEDIPLVVAAGGDGTVNSIASALIGSNTQLGILPLGTANILARNLGISVTNQAAALKMLFTSHPRLLDVGKLGSSCFTAMAGIGLDAKVALDASPWLKKKLGTFAYALQFPLTSLRYRRPQYKLSLASGEVLYDGPAWGLIATNFPHYSYRLPLAPHAQSDDGLLDFLLFRGASLPKLITQVARSFFANSPLPKHTDVLTFQSDSLEVETDPASPVEADGELIGNTPCKFEVMKAALTVLAPQ